MKVNVCVEGMNELREEIGKLCRPGQIQGGDAARLEEYHKRLVEVETKLAKLYSMLTETTISGKTKLTTFGNRFRNRL